MSVILSTGGSGYLSGGVSLTETPQTETPLYAKERAVRILLECTLVDSCKSGTSDTLHYLLIIVNVFET